MIETYNKLERSRAAKCRIYSHSASELSTESTLVCNCWLVITLIIVFAEIKINVIKPRISEMSETYLYE